MPNWNILCCSLNLVPPVCSQRRWRAAGHHLRHNYPFGDWRLLLSSFWALDTITHHGLTEKTRCRHCTSFSWQMSFCGNLVMWKTVWVAFDYGQDVGVSSCKVASNFLPRITNRVWCILGNTSSLWKPTEVHSKTILEDKGILLSIQIVRHLLR